MYGRGGAQMSFGPPHTPEVIKNLMIANLVVFIAQIAGPRFFGFDISRLFTVSPGTVWDQYELWRMFTYMWLHGSLLHIAMNMFMLWMFGTAVEHAWGSRPFLRYYLVCGIGGGLAQALISWGSDGYIVGASAAVMGLMLAYAIMYPNQRVYLYGIIQEAVD